MQQKNTKASTYGEMERYKVKGQISPDTSVRAALLETLGDG
jgi:hypothetical protein